MQIPVCHLVDQNIGYTTKGQILKRQLYCSISAKLEESVATACLLCGLCKAKCCRSNQSNSDPSYARWYGVVRKRCRRSSELRSRRTPVKVSALPTASLFSILEVSSSSCCSRIKWCFLMCDVSRYFDRGKARSSIVNFRPLRKIESSLKFKKKTCFWVNTWPPRWLSTPRSAPISSILETLSPRPRQDCRFRPSQVKSSQVDSDPRCLVLGTPLQRGVLSNIQ